MTEQVLDILKLALLALLYLFFARVLWAVWSEVRRPIATTDLPRAIDPTPAGPARPVAPGRRAVKPPAGRKGIPARLAIIDPPASRGVIYAVGEPITFGREADNSVVLADDTFVSGHHARVARVGDEVILDDLGSRNGTFLNGARVTLQHRVSIGDRIQIGYTVLEAQ